MNIHRAHEPILPKSFGTTHNNSVERTKEMSIPVLDTRMKYKERNRACLKKHRETPITTNNNQTGAIRKNGTV